MYESYVKYLENKLDKIESRINFYNGFGRVYVADTKDLVKQENKLNKLGSKRDKLSDKLNKIFIKEIEKSIF